MVEKRRWQRAGTQCTLHARRLCKLICVYKLICGLGTHRQQGEEAPASPQGQCSHRKVLKLVAATIQEGRRARWRGTAKCRTEQNQP